MERIASFSVDHLLLEPGVYVSRIDRDPATGAAVTTFDLRLTTPNKEPVMNTAECHTIEHGRRKLGRNVIPNVAIGLELGIVDRVDMHVRSCSFM